MTTGTGKPDIPAAVDQADRSASTLLPMLIAGLVLIVVGMIVVAVAT
jgi:hypothetical protein